MARKSECLMFTKLSIYKMIFYKYFYLKNVGIYA